MGAGHVHALYVHDRGRLHGVAPQCKLVALVLYVLAVVSTPREALAAFALHAAVLVVVAGFAGLTPGGVGRRLLLEAPFLAFAAFLPFVGSGQRMDVAGLSLSIAGSWAAWAIVAKGTLGVAASVILASTTPVTEILVGLDRLRLPRIVTAIAGFMVRYLDVTTAEVQRMAVARRSRAYDPRWLWEARAVASSAGTLFVRSFERGERVHLAMVSRGYDGTLPRLEDRGAPRRDWVVALAVPFVAVLVSLAARMVQA
ncbi:MAG: Transrane component NikQ of energizing module of nickel transporter [Acidimicrobiales bacterium]|nr:Transrane component NikQ of energizing module of nickel transporter [Acidimicrobiales bacterium]